MPSDLSLIPEKLLAWYTANARELPWRKFITPYRVLVSETMLQQTRISTVIDYFERFTRMWPDEYALASASQDDVLKMWEGLGYYSRARNLHKACVTVAQAHAFPDTYEGLLKLPGVGEYTAAAIASIAFGRPCSVVDGNVLRVLARLTDDPRDVMRKDAKKEARELLNTVIPFDAPGNFNQAVMELGETLCLPCQVPLCASCPLSSLCLAAKNGTAASLPVRSKPKARSVQAVTVLLIVQNGCVLLRKRPVGGLLGGMWSFPTEEADFPLPPDALPLPPHKHLFTHIEWHMNAYLLTDPDLKARENEVFATADELLSRYAIPSAYRSYVDHITRYLS